MPHKHARRRTLGTSGLQGGAAPDRGVGGAAEAAAARIALLRPWMREKLQGAQALAWSVWSD